MNRIKINIIFLVTLSISCFAADETMDISHAANSVALCCYLWYYSPLYNLPASGAANAQFLPTRVDYQRGVDITLSGLSVPILTAITGSTSAQNVNVSSVVGLTSNVLLDAGLSTQEVVAQTAVDATHFNAIVRKNHTTSGTTRPVYSSFSKWLQSAAAIPGTWAWSNITNINFIRANPLPSNMFDQYKTFAAGGSIGGCIYEEDTTMPLLSTATQVLDTVPTYSAGSLSGTGNPTNAISLAAGPISTTTDIVPCIKIELLFTSVPEPFQILATYQIWWDRN